MKSQSLLGQQGSLAPVVVTCQPVESLIERSDESFWEKQILSDNHLGVLATRRKTLVSILDRVFSQSPKANLDLGFTIKSGKVSEQTLVLLYSKLTELLQQERYSERLLLYFPIELIPGEDWEPLSSELALAMNGFRCAYKCAWSKLLHQQDIRANFVDGDIPEVEIRTGPLPTVVKAAHLTPFLVQKGLLTEAEVLALKQETDNPALVRSINEVWRPATPPTPKQNRPPIRNVARFVSSRLGEIPNELRLIRERHRCESASKPESRVAWELRCLEAHAINQCATEIADLFTRSGAPLRSLLNPLVDAGTKEVRLVGIHAVRTIVETDAAAYPERARETYRTFEPLLEQWWQTGEPRTREALESYWSRTTSAGITDESRATRIGTVIPRPDLGERLSNPERYAPAIEITRTITADAEASRLLVPVVMLYGSQVKGYGSLNADIDLAFFVKPEVPLSLRGHVQKQLAELTAPFGISGKPLEFWLEKNGASLKIRDFENPDRSLGDSTLTHVLFGSLWVGEIDSMKLLFRTVLTDYLRPTDTTVFGQCARELWLRELERDALQYRLMHKSYHHFYPERWTAHLPRMMPDHRGAFWDSGYRRLATKLFLSKVFLPSIGTLR